MKSLLYPLLMLAAGANLLAAAPAHAQMFPNNTLDAWETRSGTESPVNWLTTDDLVEYRFKQRIASGTVVKTTVAHGGAYAAELQTKQFNQQVRLFGYLQLGKSFRGSGGLPFTSRPTSIQFYYQLSGPQAVADSAAVEVQLSRRVDGKATLIGGNLYYFKAPAADYTLVTVPLQYLSGMAPDSMTVTFVSGDARKLTPGTTLRIDDITFNATATATHDAVAEAAISVFPNPSPDGHYVLNSTEPGLLAAPLTVRDATGRVVRREAAAGRLAATRTLDLSALPSGLYTVQLATARGPVTRQLSR